MRGKIGRFRCLDKKKLKKGIFSLKSIPPSHPYLHYIQYVFPRFVKFYREAERGIFDETNIGKKAIIKF